jgi:hypothetical protein
VLWICRELFVGVGWILLSLCGYSMNGFESLTPLPSVDEMGRWFMYPCIVVPIIPNNNNNNNNNSNMSRLLSIHYVPGSHPNLLLCLTD